MNQIDIKEAIEATGKSEKTIRRLLAKPESQPFIYNKDNKIVVDVNYLFNAYPPIKKAKKEGGQNLDINEKMSIDIELLELKHKLTLYEQEIKHKESLLIEKDNRIDDLQKAMLFLEVAREQKTIIKKPWWKF